jgi:hypothetical protein
MWVFLGIFLAAMARGDEVVQLHPHGGVLQESGKNTRPFLKIICPEKIKNGREEFEGYPVCPAPPPFVGESALPGQFGIRKVYLGHFTTPAADEAVLATSGGEPHAANYGGTALLERKNGEWEFQWYRGGLITKDCAVVKRQDRSELLVCFLGDIHQGVSGQDIYTVDPKKPKDSEQATLLGLMDDTINCGGYLNLQASVSVQSSAFKEIALTKNGTLLTATVNFGTRKYSPEERARCAIGVNRHFKVPTALAPETKPYAIQFDWDGAQFRLQPESAKFKSTVEQQSENR